MELQHLQLQQRGGRLQASAGTPPSLYWSSTTMCQLQLSLPITAYLHLVHRISKQVLKSNNCDAHEIDVKKTVPCIMGT